MFWTVATVMVVLVTVSVLAPMYWIRAGDEAGARRRPVVAAGAIAAVVPLCALGLYAWLGRPELVATGALPGHAATAGALAPVAAGTAGAAGDLAAAVARLEQRLASAPDDPAGWELLAQSYEYAGRTADAAAARARRLPPAAAESGALARLDAAGLAAVASSLPAASDALVAEAQQARRARDFPRALAAFAALERRQALDAALWADYADAMAAQRGKLDEVSEPMIRRALALESRNAKALWLLGSLQVQRSDYAAALQTWRTLQEVLPPGSPDARLIAENVAEARTMLGDGDERKVAPRPAAATATANGAAAGVALRGDIDLDPRWRDQVAPDTTLYVFARAEDQPGPPVAVLRTTVSRWPQAFVLDDSLAMLPGRNLSSTSRVVVEARLSRSGSADPRPGDLRGRSAPLDPRRAGRLRIVIAEEVS